MVFATLVILSPLGAARADLVLNGSFEDGDFDSSLGASMTLMPGQNALQAWEVFNGSVRWITGWWPANGSRFVQLVRNGDGSYGGVRQTITTVPGEEYRLSFSFNAGPIAGGRPSSVTVSAGASQQLIATGMCPDLCFAWRRHQMAFVATSSTTTISIVGRSGSYIRIDQVSVTESSGDPVGIGSLTLSTAEVAGCRSVRGTATLTTPPIAGGVVVSLSDTLSAASTPISLKFEEGESSRTFVIRTAPVAERQVGEVSATLGSTTLTRPLVIRPIGVRTLRLASHTVAGSQPVSGTIALECPAGPGPITVSLSSSDETAARPVAASIVVPQGLQTVPIDVATSLVPARTRTTIEAFANDIGRSAGLTLTPAVSVSARRLAFDDQAVGTISPARSVTLKNEAAVAVAIDRIELVGARADWFMVTENCPGWLAAGASCTISVRFKPVSVAHRSVPVTIATSATAMPLVVWVSGSGI